MYSITTRVSFMSFEFILAGIIFSAWYMNKTTGDMSVTRDNLGLYIAVLAFSFVTGIVMSEFFLFLMENPGFPAIWITMGGVMLVVQAKHKRAK